MSLRRWNTSSERSRFQNYVEFSYRLLLYKYSVADFGVDDDDDNVSLGSVSSDLSNSSESSIDTVEFVLRKTCDYGDMVYARFEDKKIDWEAPPPLIADMDDGDCINELRFRKVHLEIVAKKLWPLVEPYLDGTYESIRLQNRYVLPFETCFMLLLFRLAAPRRIQPDMERFFGIRKSKISAALYTIVDALYDVALPFLSNPAIFQHRFELYSQLILNKCNAAENIWGFIDGTLRKICRPTYFQRAAYSGHKRTHGIKFQSVTTPDGLIACLFGPIPGSRHDSFMLAESGLLLQLEQMMPRNQPGVTVYSLYGDPAYPQSRYLVGGYRNPAPNSVEAQWNTAMSKVRIAVEWGFKEITQSWTFLDLRSRMKIFKFPVSKYYIVAAFLTNIRNCFYSNQTAIYFDCSAENGRKLSLDQYLNLVNAWAAEQQE